MMEASGQEVNEQLYRGSAENGAQWILEFDHDL